MNHVSALRDRYDAVMRQFEEADEQERDQSERLLRAITDIGDWLHHQRAVTEEYRRKNEQLSDENEQLRFMLHSLLVGIESRNRGTMTKAMVEVESRLSGLMKQADAAGGKQVAYASAASGSEERKITGEAASDSSGEAALAIPDDHFTDSNADDSERPQSGDTVAEGYAPFPVDEAASAPKPPPFPYADAESVKK